MNKKVGEHPIRVDSDYKEIDKGEIVYIQHGTYSESS